MVKECRKTKTRFSTRLIFLSKLRGLLGGMKLKKKAMAKQTAKQVQQASGRRVFN